MLGVSMDSVPRQKAFAEKFSLPFSLLSDPEARACDAFLVEHPGDRPKRETFLFKNGQLVDHDRAVSPRSQAKDILELVAQMNQSSPIPSER